ncbi:LysR family transcriptional regulator [Azospirillum sp. TSH100]|uniref:LysR substrate-binding domain-containing protein n=1 Tax=Azospirillum sp. TSH100 TaxID=652764 RepID=UPI000D60A54B|nr:LysR substrate-binding domain-containing protein [Azospirillum sp. TSH100]PWC73469.1 LysR family transcriptional regulator [Azospirillum sp. TSH100]QCG87269.1 LysR family transcriptional regulator [Azospirillum sp. TSH100]
MPANLDTDLLRAFVAVADSASFTRAGERLGRTQAAVSQQVRRLEDTVGKRVFERDTHGVRMTRDGEVLLAYARRMLTLNDEVLALMHRSPTVASVRIGTPDDYATMLLPEILARFNAAYPDVMVEVVCDNSPDLVAEIDKGRYDLALITRKAGETGGELVRQEPVSWVAPPQDPVPPAGHRPVESLDPLPLALFPKGCVVRDIAVAALDGMGRDWRVAFTSKSVVAVHGAVMGGLGVTAMEACTVPSSLRRIGAAEGFPDLPDVDIALHRARGTAPKPVRLLADAIHDLVGGQLPGRQGSRPMTAVP